MKSRITRQFRELFARLPAHVQPVAALDGDTRVWFWIGSHADYDKLLEKM